MLLLALAHVLPVLTAQLPPVAALAARLAG
jgi:hypothetical protein